MENVRIRTVALNLPDVPTQTVLSCVEPQDPSFTSTIPSLISHSTLLLLPLLVPRSSPPAAHTINSNPHLSDPLPLILTLRLFRLPLPHASVLTSHLEKILPHLTVITSILTAITTASTNVPPWFLHHHNLQPGPQRASKQSSNYYSRSTPEDSSSRGNAVEKAFRTVIGRIRWCHLSSVFHETTLSTKHSSVGLFIQHCVHYSY